MAKLKDFYKTFAWELVRTNSGVQAYLNATGETAVSQKERLKASVKASQLASNPQVRIYLQQIRNELAIGVPEIVSELANIIRFDPLEMLNDNGTVKELKDMPETARKMIAGLEVSELWFGRGEDREQYGVVKKIKFISKMDAIDKTLKHLGGYKEDNDQKKSVTQIAIFELPNNNRSVNAVTVGEPIAFEVVNDEKTEVRETAESINRAGGRGVQDNLGSAGHLTLDIQNDYGPGD